MLDNVPHEEMRGEINLDMEILVAWRQLRSGERVVLGSVGWSDLVER